LAIFVAGVVDGVKLESRERAENEINLVTLD